MGVAWPRASVLQNTPRKKKRKKKRFRRTKKGPSVRAVRRKLKHPTPCSRLFSPIRVPTLLQKATSHESLRFSSNAADSWRGSGGLPTWTCARGVCVGTRGGGDVPAKLRRASAAEGLGESRAACSETRRTGACGQVSQASEERVAQLPGSGAASRLRRGPGRWRGGDVQRLAAGPINRVSFPADPTQGLFQGRTPVLLLFLFFF